MCVDVLMQNTHIHIPFVRACAFMCLACLWEITQSAGAAAAAENGAFVAAVASHYRVGVTPQNPARQAVCVSLPVEAIPAAPLAAYCSWESVIGSGNVS